MLLVGDFMANELDKYRRPAHGEIAKVNPVLEKLGGCIVDSSLTPVPGFINGVVDGIRFRLVLDPTKIRTTDQAKPLFEALDAYIKSKGLKSYGGSYGRPLEDNGKPFVDIVAVAPHEQLESILKQIQGMAPRLGKA